MRKIIVRQNPADIEKAFRLISKPCDQKVNETGLMKQICVDGKTLNGSFSHAKDQRGARVFAAFSCYEDIVLAHIPLSSDKEHEITALQELRILGCKGMYCVGRRHSLPKKTFEIAEKKEVYFLTQVKNNQESLSDQIKHGCLIQKPTQFYQDNVDKDHGRIEQRTYETFNPFPMLNKWKKDWPYIRQIIRVTRVRHELSTNKESVETHFYVSNKELDAQDYATYIRKHWHIENKLHNVKDNAFLEDKHTKRCNPFIFSCLIDIVLNIMRKNKDGNIRKNYTKILLNFKK